MARRIGLLVCGHVHPDAQDLGGDYPELFGELFEPHGYEVVPFAAEDGVLPDSIDDCDAWLTSPSRASVTDDLPWIAGVSEFLVAAVRAERPVIGVCFGHQLLAEALGGAVERAAVGWGIGVKTYDVVSPKPWMTPALDRVNLVASHEDQVTVLPDGAELLLSAEYCPNAAYALGERCIALQPHIEFSAALSGRLMTLREAITPAPIIAAARATLTLPVDRVTVAGWFANFLDTV
ncbi:MAG: hypothetical protein GX868_13685 [Actinobacteria bacterium]|nr:hypothetical protein [Actinomycetota bacterium]